VYLAQYTCPFNNYVKCFDEGQMSNRVMPPVLLHPMSSDAMREPDPLRVRCTDGIKPKGRLSSLWSSQLHPSITDERNGIQCTGWKLFVEFRSAPWQSNDASQACAAKYHHRLATVGFARFKPPSISIVTASDFLRSANSALLSIG
jgi:hypothetical protein